MSDYHCENCKFFEDRSTDKLIEGLKCVIADISEQCEQLKAENAALRERLEKAVELPCKVGDKLYFVNEYLRTPRIEEYNIKAVMLLSSCIRIYVDDVVYFLEDDDVCFSLEAAEARLAELGGEK